MTTKQKRDYYKETTEKLVAALEAAIAEEKSGKAIIPWHKPFITNRQFARNFNSKRVYRGWLNQFFLGLHGYGSPYWATYPGWKEASYKEWAKANKVKIDPSDVKSARSRRGKFEKTEAWLARQTPNVQAWTAAGGGGVKAGEESELVVLYMPVDNKKFDPSQPESRENRKRIWLLRGYPVFNIEQTTGITIPETDEKEFDNEPLQAAESIWEGYEGRPELKSGDPAYAPQTDVMFMPDIKKFETAEDYYSALFHESIHSTGHKSRLGRDMSVAFGRESYSKEELTAELGASMLRGIAGIEVEATEENSVRYLRYWIGALKDDPKMVIYASTKAAAAADHILGVTHSEDNTAEADGS